MSEEGLSKLLNGHPVAGAPSRGEVMVLVLRTHKTRSSAPGSHNLVLQALELLQTQHEQGLTAGIAVLGPAHREPA